MSIINCSTSDCIYQKDGICEYNNVKSSVISEDKDENSCAYYSKKSSNKQQNFLT